PVHNPDATFDQFVEDREFKQAYDKANTLPDEIGHDAKLLLLEKWREHIGAIDLQDPASLEDARKQCLDLIRVFEKDANSAEPIAARLSPEWAKTAQLWQDVLVAQFKVAEDQLSNADADRHDAHPLFETILPECLQTYHPKEADNAFALLRLWLDVGQLR